MSAPRFLVIAGDRDEGPLPFAPPPGFTVVTDEPGLRILSSTPQALVWPEGVVLGTLFARFGPPTALARLDETTRCEIIATRGQVLIDRYWGGYCAVLRVDGEIIILRDPSGALPCYYATADGWHVFGSDAELLLASGLWRPGIAWSGLTHHLYCAGLPTESTPLRGLRELLPGTAAHVRRRACLVESRWSPWDHVVQRDDLGSAAVAERLRRVVQTTVAAWAACFPRILMGVSGGLDSSIVAASVSATSSALLAVTMVTEDPEGDERVFAEALSQAIHVDMIERYYQMTDIDIHTSCVAHLPRPIGRAHALAYDRAMHVEAQQHSIDAFFSGNGGDNVFAYSQSATCLVDRLRSEGVSARLLATLLDICTLTGCTPWQALVAAARKILSKTSSYRWRPDTTFLHPEVIAAQAAIPLDHPWLRAPRDAMPGKAAHIAALLRIQSGLEGYDRGQHPPIINPLMSQPVMETCLAIPTWQWIAGGRNRSVARDAFKLLLPDMIVARTTKGGPDGFANQVIVRHRTEIRERLRDGHMAGAQLLDVAALDDALRDEKPDFGVAQVRILSLLDTEAWLDHWTAR